MAPENIQIYIQLLLWYFQNSENFAKQIEKALSDICKMFNEFEKNIS